MHCRDTCRSGVPFSLALNAFDHGNEGNCKPTFIHEHATSLTMVWFLDLLAPLRSTLEMHPDEEVVVSREKAS